MIRLLEHAAAAFAAALIMTVSFTAVVAGPQPSASVIAPAIT